MDGKIDTIKGRLKEAVGVLTDNDHLKREGQRDQVVGEVQDKAARVAEQVREEVARAVEKVKNARQAPDPTVPPRDARGPPQTEYGARRPESTTRPPGPLRDLAL